MKLWDLIKKAIKSNPVGVGIKTVRGKTKPAKTPDPKIVVYSSDELVSKLSNPTKSVNYTVTPESPRGVIHSTEERKSKYRAPTPPLDTRFMNENDVDVTNLGAERLDYSKFKGKLGYIPKK